MSTSENEADDEKSDYEKRIEENKRSLQEEVERAMNNAELEVCYFDHDHVCKIPSLVPMPPPFVMDSKECEKQERPCIVHHVSGCQMDICRKEHIFKSLTL